MKTKYSTFLAVFIAAIGFLTPQKLFAQNTSVLPLIPYPVSYSWQADSFYCKNEVQIRLDRTWFKDSQISIIKEIWKDYAQVKALVNPLTSDLSAAIHILCNPRTGTSPEAYRIYFKKGSIFIEANSFNGALYAMLSLIQIRNTQTHYIPGVSLQDEPRFAWRGIMLDVSRHFFNKEYIKKLIRLMAFYKLNTLHLHLSDDQGWRIESKKYPKLTTMGAWRDDKRHEPWNYYQFVSTPGKPQYGGYYTQADMKELILYAKNRNITIVPEIDLPGHSAAAIYAYNWLSCAHKPWTLAPNAPFEFSDPLCICDDNVVAFAKDILLEIIDLFPSEYVHIGGDECKHEAWEHVPLCKQIMEKEGLKSTLELQGRFNRQIEALIRSKKKIMIGWDEILEGGVSQNAAIMSWRSIQGGIEAAKHKHRFVMASSTNLYFDMPQSESEFTSEWLRVLPLEKVYAFEPVPSELTTDEAKYMLGVQACLWTENMQTPEHVESQLLPRGLALSEIAWTPAAQKNYENFISRLPSTFSVLESLGYNYYVPEPQGLNEKQLFLDKTEVNVRTHYPFAVIRYTTDGSEPTANSPICRGPIIIDKPTTIKAKTFLSNGKSSRTLAGTFTKGPLQEPLQNYIPKGKGLSYKYYEIMTHTLRALDSARASREGVVDSLAFPRDVRADSWAVEYNGVLFIPQDGIYTFSTASDDGSELYVNGEKIVDNDGVHGIIEKGGSVALKKGYHSFKVRYFEGNFGESLQVFWQGPGIDKQIIPSSNLFQK